MIIINVKVTAAFLHQLIIAISGKKYKKEIIKDI